MESDRRGKKNSGRARRNHERGQEKKSWDRCQLLNSVAASSASIRNRPRRHEGFLTLNRENGYPLRKTLWSKLFGSECAFFEGFRGFYFPGNTVTDERRVEREIGESLRPRTIPDTPRHKRIAVSAIRPIRTLPCRPPVDWDSNPFNGKERAMSMTGSESRPRS